MGTTMTLVIMIIEVFSFFAADISLVKVIENIMIENKSEKKQVDSKSSKLIACTVLLVIISVLNIIINCTFLSFSERIKYCIIICIFYIISALFNAWTFKGAEYKKENKHDTVKNKKNLIVITAVVFTIFLICIVTNLYMKLGI